MLPLLSVVGIAQHVEFLTRPLRLHVSEYPSTVSSVAKHLYDSLSRGTTTALPYQDG